MVGFNEVPQQTPRAVTVLPPSPVTLPPEVAVVVVILVTPTVVTTGKAISEVVKVMSFPKEIPFKDIKSVKQGKSIKRRFAKNKCYLLIQTPHTESNHSDTAYINKVISMLHTLSESFGITTTQREANERFYKSKLEHIDTATLKRLSNQIATFCQSETDLYTTHNCLMQTISILNSNMIKNHFSSP